MNRSKHIGKIRKRLEEAKNQWSRLGKVDFSHNESARLATDALLDDGVEAYRRTLQEEGEVDFLSPTEATYIADNAKGPCCGDGTGGEEDALGAADDRSVGTRYPMNNSEKGSEPALLHQYGADEKPYLKDKSTTTVYFQGEKPNSLREIVRRCIHRTTQALAIIMDEFTDAEIFCDVLEAANKRNVVVYLLLDLSNIKLFTDMCEKLQIRDIHLKQVGEAAVDPPQELCHDLNPGDWVLIKKHVRKSCLDPRWRGPLQVILVTTTAVKVAGLATWVHAAHTRRVPPPLEGQRSEAEETTTGDTLSGGVERVTEGETSSEPSSTTVEASSGGSEGIVRRSFEISEESDLSDRPTSPEEDTSDTDLEEGVRSRRKRGWPTERWPEQGERVRSISEGNLSDITEEVTEPVDEATEVIDTRRRTRRIRVPNRRYTSPEWLYSLSDGYDYLSGGE